MNNKKLAGFGLPSGKTSLLMATAVALSFGCHKSNVNDKDLKDFSVVNLVANTAEYQPKRIDPTLINGFGIAWSPTGIAWVNSVGGHVSELYRSEGDSVRPGVWIPSSLADSVGATTGLPCGIVFNGTKGFTLSNGKPAAFLFTGFDGVLSGWNGGNNAKFLKHPNGASYTGLAIASNGGNDFIYAANFGKRKIDVWDTAFHLVSMAFKDPTLPWEYSPYNIQEVGGYLFVMYAKLDTVGANAGHGVEGKGLGYVSVFNTDGSFVKRFASKGTLDVPWGVTMAPGSFLEDKDMGNDGGDGHGGGYGSNSYGSSSNNNHHNPKDPVVLVGNFGDGHINVYSQDGNFLGQLQSHKKPLEIEGLWALTFPPTAAGIDPARLYFSAGPEKESDGVFGYIIKK